MYREWSHSLGRVKGAVAIAEENIGGRVKRFGLMLRTLFSSSRDNVTSLSRSPAITDQSSLHTTVPNSSVDDPHAVISYDPLDVLMLYLFEVR